MTSPGLPYPKSNGKHWRRGRQLGHIMPPPTPSYLQAAVVQAREQERCCLLKAMALVRFRSLTTHPFPLKAYRQESFLLLLLLVLPHPLSTNFVNIPIILHASMTLSAEASSLELTSLAMCHLFSVGFLPETDLTYQFPFPYFSPATLPSLLLPIPIRPTLPPCFCTCCFLYPEYSSLGYP